MAKSHGTRHTDWLAYKNLSEFLLERCNAERRFPELFGMFCLLLIEPEAHVVHELPRVFIQSAHQIYRDSHMANAPARTKEMARKQRCGSLQHPETLKGLVRQPMISTQLQM